MKTSSDNKNINIDNCIVLDENTRVVFIVYDYNEIDGNLKYAGTIFNKIDKNDSLTPNEIEFHKKTALSRFNKRPVEVTIDTHIQEDKINKKVRTCFFHYGLKGERLRNIEENKELKTSNLNDSYESTNSVFSNSSNTSASISPKKSPISDYYFDRFNFEIPESKRWSRTSLSSIEDEEKEINKFNEKINLLRDTHRYVDNNRDIFIKTEFNKETGNLNYGATIYQKKNPDDRLTQKEASNHFFTAGQRLLKCPLTVPYDHILMKNNGYDFLEEDVMYNIVDNICYDKNGNSKIKIRGLRCNI